jgi:hypothetical protein
VTRALPESATSLPRGRPASPAWDRSMRLAPHAAHLGCHLPSLFSRWLATDKVAPPILIENLSQRSKETDVGFLDAVGRDRTWLTGRN